MWVLRVLGEVGLRILLFYRCTCQKVSSECEQKKYTISAQNHNHNSSKSTQNKERAHLCTCMNYKMSASAVQYSELWICFAVSRLNIGNSPPSTNGSTLRTQRWILPLWFQPGGLLQTCGGSGLTWLWDGLLSSCRLKCDTGDPVTYC